MYSACSHPPGFISVPIQCRMGGFCCSNRIFQVASNLCGWYRGFQACRVQAAQTVNDYSASNIQVIPPPDFVFLYCPTAPCALDLASAVLLGTARSLALDTPPGEAYIP
jgi:hypothetical protein